MVLKSNVLNILILLGGLEFRAELPDEEHEVESSEILTFDPSETGHSHWRVLSHMIEKRFFYAMGIIPDIDRICP